jgi:glutathione synthase
MEILFVTDALETFKTYKDSTFAMMREAQRRGHTIHACEPRHMLWERGGVVQAQVRSITLTGNATDWFSEVAPQVHSIKDFGAVVMRKDPPFDSE